MANLKLQFSEMKNTVPKSVQWLLLVAAFLIVLILLFLLLPSDKNKAQEKKEVVDAALFIKPSEVNWSDVKIGSINNQRIKITSSVETKIASVKFSKEIPGLTFNSDCLRVRINDTVSCNITLEWKPTHDVMGTGTAIQITYHAVNTPENMALMDSVPVMISTAAQIADAAPMQKKADVESVVKETKPEQPVAEESKTEKVADMQSALDAVSKMSQEEKNAMIADTPSLALKTENEIKELPSLAAVPETTVSKDIKNTAVSAKASLGSSSAAEKCYEFAFPGYGLSGQQTGWIRASRGGYKFHPFSDLNCNAPIGNYNSATGIITDINDPSKTIGTDAEHVGYRSASGSLTVPQLSSAPDSRNKNHAAQLDVSSDTLPAAPGGSEQVFTPQKADSILEPSSIAGGEAVVSSEPYDRTFVLRQYKPIPATIVSEIRADPKNMSTLPVQATVDRNVYSDNGRTIVVPAGTLMLGYVTGELPGPYKSIGRMQVNWYRFVRPDGVEFNFADNGEPFSADAQGRVGVPGYGSTDYMEQFLMPMITAIVPAAVNMIAPISDKFVNQINLDDNTVVQTGNVRSSELAKNEIITAWNSVAQRLAVDMLDNTVPPFSIAAGTRITVFSPKDLVVNFCNKGVDGVDTCELKAAPYAGYKSSAVKTEGGKGNTTVDYTDPSWIGQVRSLNLQMSDVCDSTGGVRDEAATKLIEGGVDYRTLVAWCQSNQYQAKSTAQWNAYYQQQSTGSGSVKNLSTSDYNSQVLGLKTDKTTGNIQNPFESTKKNAQSATGTGATTPVVTCPEDGAVPDANGCCTGEVFDTTVTSSDSPAGSCCPTTGGDCFPPIIY